MQQRRKPGCKPITIAVLGALTLGATPLAAWAQESLPAVTVTASKDKDGYVAATSASGTKTEMALRDVPQTINVVPAAVIRDQNAMSIQDIMKNIPGVGLSTGDGQRDQVFIRGFTAIGDQFVDGFRDDALYFRDLSNVERLEVIKGPAAVLYGRGSSGGLVNRITKKPGVDITDVALSLTNTKGRRGEVDVGRVGETVDWRFTGARELSDSYRDQQFINRTALSPSVAIRLSGATKLLLQGDYLEDRRLTDFGIPSYQGRPVAVDARTYYGAANARDADFSQSRVVSTAATLTHKFSDSLSLRNAFRYYDYHLDRNNTNISGNVNEVKGTMSLGHAKLNRDESGWFNQTELTQKLVTGTLRHEVLYGAEFGKQNKDASSWASTVVATNVSIFHPVLPQVEPQQAGRAQRYLRHLRHGRRLRAGRHQHSATSGRRWPACATTATSSSRAWPMRWCDDGQICRARIRLTAPAPASSGNRARRSRTTRRGAARSSRAARTSPWPRIMPTWRRKPRATRKWAPSTTCGAAAPTPPCRCSAWSATISRPATRSPTASCRSARSARMAWS